VGVGRQVGQLRRAVFLDRDGVLNRAVVRDGRPYPPAGIAELDVLPGVPAALERLRRAGFLLLVVTNQPDVARGDQQRATVDALNSALARTLPLDDVLVCFHDDADGCDCRKPLPGLLLRGAARYGLDLVHSFLVGDRWRDIAAGQGAGVRTVFIDYGYNERRPDPAADATVADLAAAVDWIESHAA
jgi:D-glycero-D-manno-heptose 1,7-bisphosphate phosphatase